MTSLELPVWAPRLDRGRGLLRDLRRAPFTWILITVLLVTTVALRHLVNSQATDVMRWASTNIQNLTHAPVRSFIASALVLPGELWLPYALALLVSLGVLERRLGTARAMVVFLAGHVIATLLTEGAVWYWYGVREGGLPEAVRDQLDVGVSYGLWACVAAALFFAPRGLRWPAAIAVAGYMIAALIAEPGMTASGHVLATAIGFLAWAYLRHSRSQRRAGVPVRRAPQPPDSVAYITSDDGS